MHSGKVVGLVLGALLVALAMLMLVPALADLVAERDDWAAFLLAAAITGFAGGGLMLAFSTEDRDLGYRATFMMTTLGWLGVSAFAALPFVFSKIGVSYTDAFFEAISGVTTTGATVFSGLDNMPPGILLWRALLQWIGGVGIIVTAVAILPFLRVGGMQLFRTESSDRSEKVLPRPGQIALAIAEIYLLLTVLCAVLYMVGGMTPFDAMTHAMTTLSTGGYSTHDASFGFFENPWLSWVAVVFMIAGALPLVVYIHMIRGEHDALWKDPQVRGFLAFLAIAVLILGGSIWMAGHYDLLEAFRHSAFNVVSIVTTTGYATTDYSIWSPFSMMFFFILTFVGGCTGSTAGGMKIFRFQILGILFRTQMRQTLYPHVAQTLRYGERTVDREIVFSVGLFIVLYFATVFGIALALAGLGIEFITAISASATAVGNVGPGLGEIVGPSGNFATLPDAAKWLLSAGMLMGRLELLTVFIMFTKNYWEQ